MKVRAEFFSRLKEIAGQRFVEVTLPDDATIEFFFERLVADFPRLRDFKRSVLFGIGVEFVDGHHALTDGDEIAVMPPVQGG